VRVEKKVFSKTRHHTRTGPSVTEVRGGGDQKRFFLQKEEGIEGPHIHERFREGDEAQSFKYPGISQREKKWKYTNRSAGMRRNHNPTEKREPVVQKHVRMERAAKLLRKQPEG